jgi:pyridoxal phosphate enzyme (YggS family)
MSDDNLHTRMIDVQQRIAAAAARAKRNLTSVRLVAVSKHQPVGLIQEYLTLCSACGKGAPAPIIGENYVQEFRTKCVELKGVFEAHLIGPLQRNKAKDAVMLFDCIEAVPSWAVLEAINAAATNLGKVQRCFLQVNISHDDAKSGFVGALLLEEIHERLFSLSSIRVEGLMTVTKFYENPEDARPDFKRLAELARQIETYRDKIKPSALAPVLELSMGMSADFEIAIEEGATLVRVGTAIFGDRHAPRGS